MKQRLVSYLIKVSKSQKYLLNSGEEVKNTVRTRGRQVVAISKETEIYAERLDGSPVKVSALLILFNTALELPARTVRQDRGHPYMKG